MCLKRIKEIVSGITFFTVFNLFCVAIVLLNYNFVFFEEEHWAAFIVGIFFFANIVFCDYEDKKFFEPFKQHTNINRFLVVYATIYPLIFSVGFLAWFYFSYVSPSIIFHSNQFYFYFVAMTSVVVEIFADEEFEFLIRSSGSDTKI